MPIKTKACKIQKPARAKAAMPHEPIRPSNRPSGQTAAKQHSICDTCAHHLATQMLTKQKSSAMLSRCSIVRQEMPSHAFRVQQKMPQQLH
eukprot:1161821-Pelagomonas_calceolata.AAC.14